MPRAKRIEQLAPELEKLWWHEDTYLLPSDIQNNSRMKYAPGTRVSIFQEPTNRANGSTRDLQERLIACEHSSRLVTRQELDGHHCNRQQLPRTATQQAE